MKACIPTRTLVAHPRAGQILATFSLATLLAAPPLAPAAEVVGWGLNDQQYGQATVPDGLENVVALAAGGNHSLALRAGGTVVAWGASGLTNVPATGDFVAIAAGSRHSLGLRRNGTVVAWGSNDNGEKNPPVGLNNVVAVAAGGDYSLALRADGTVIGWGDYGSASPLPPNLKNVLAVGVGWYHSVALKSDGTVVAWGDNQVGQTDVPNGLSKVVAIAAGLLHNLALRADGTVVGWGSNAAGQTIVPAGLSNVVAISAGGSHSLALLADGTVVGWGENSHGQASFPSGSNQAVAIAAGGSHSLALTGLPNDTASPQLVGPQWLIGTLDRPFHHYFLAKNGADSFGAQGLPAGLVLDTATGLVSGSPTESGSFSVVISAINGMGADHLGVTLLVNRLLPGIVGGLVTAGIGSGFDYALVTVNEPTRVEATGLPLGLTLDPQSMMISGAPLQSGDFNVSLVASNRYGLANVSLTIRVSPVLAWGATSVPPGLSNVWALAAGPNHSLALQGDGTVIGWGLNCSGAATPPDDLSNAVSVAAAGNGRFNCLYQYSLAVRADGTVAGWGSLPFTVPGDIRNAATVAAGASHALVLQTDGSVAGFGTGSAAEVPSWLHNSVAVAVGDAHSLALRADGLVAAWGDNGLGQIAVPAGLSNVVAVAAGAYHNLALRADGTVVGWGNNSDGQADVPDGLSNVVAIDAGALHSVALRDDGTAVAWGAGRAATAPVGLSNAVAVVAGYIHSLALTGLPEGLTAPTLVGPLQLIATVDRPFHHRIQARNGVMAYGAQGLPAGLVLNPRTGMITGEPTESGTFPLVLSATNSLGTDQRIVTLFVNVPLPKVASGIVATGLGMEFTYLAAPNATWVEATGLPPGLVIDQTGLFSGTPLVPGDFAVSLIASNRFGAASGSFAIRVSPVVAWGSNFVQAKTPSGLSDVIAIAAGGSHSLALRSDGTVTAWGTGAATNIPTGLENVVAIAAGSASSLALRADGFVVGWGGGIIPTGLSEVVTISAGEQHSLALRRDGTVVGWREQETVDVPGANAPIGLRNVVAIAAGGGHTAYGPEGGARNYAHSLALRSDGTVVGWGGGGRLNAAKVPAGLSNVVAIAAGFEHSLALSSDGIVVGWGVTTVPSGLTKVVAIAAGGSEFEFESHSLALLADGTVVAWGTGGGTAVPSGLSNVVAITAGGSHGLALLRQDTVLEPRLEVSQIAAGLELHAHGMPGISCQLLCASQLEGPWLPTIPFTFTNSLQMIPVPNPDTPAQFIRLRRR